MIVELEDLSREELVEALNKAINQIKNLINENQKLKKEIENDPRYF